MTQVNILWCLGHLLAGILNTTRIKNNKLRREIITPLQGKYYFYLEKESFEDKQRTTDFLLDKAILAFGIRRGKPGVMFSFGYLFLYNSVSSDQITIYPGNRYGRVKFRVTKRHNFLFV